MSGRIALLFGAAFFALCFCSAASNEVKREAFFDLATCAPLQVPTFGVPAPNAGQPSGGDYCDIDVSNVTEFTLKFYINGFDEDELMCPNAVNYER
mmetsp:Transcript_17227/g.28313  ORF Transcript_17227/g.28313 Transcript_17227/m.28313 type:complete len:96 (-) Transcript_17227:408-695(-)